MRAVRVLGEVPLVLAEDTRHTRKLFARYGIGTRLVSYHQHNKRERLDEAMLALERGNVAVVSNAGMPAIADPGFELIQAAIAAGHEVDVLPGPSALVTAVVAAALPAPGFLFAGFLPRRAGDRRTKLLTLSALPYALVVYEAPHRLVSTLEMILAVLGNRTMVVARELTKMHQEVHRGTVMELIHLFREIAPRGECTLVISGVDEPAVADEAAALHDLLSRKARGENRRVATAAVIERYGVGRNRLYDAWLHGAAEETGEHPLEAE